MGETLTLNVVTPAASAFSGEVMMVEVPGEMGDFGVLPGHAPFMSMIRPGLVRVHTDENTVENHFITAGYAEVNPDGCTILAEQLEDLDAMTKEQAQARLEEAKKAADISVDDLDRQRAMKNLSIAEAILEAL